MTQPTRYVPKFNFAVSPVPGDKINNELFSLKDTLDETLDNMALIQRDDGRLANQSVGWDQLQAEVRTGVNPATQWTVSTKYAAGDAVFNVTSLYRCLIPHTAGRSPMGIGIYFEGGGADIAWNKNHALQFSQYDGSTPPSVSTVGFVDTDGSFNWPVVKSDEVRLRDTKDTHDLKVVAGSNLTADRTFTITTGDADRTIDVEQVVHKNVANTFTARQTLGIINVGTGSAVTISGGAITPPSSYCVVDTESSAASDDLETISGGSVGDILILRAANASRTVVIKHNVGNIFCGADRTLDNSVDMITLLKASSNWYALTPLADNGA